MTDVELLKEFLSYVLVEKRMREVDITGGVRAVHGSDEHVNDLKTRIRDLSSWRDKQKRGSEARASYSRLISRLKGELSSALRTKNKQKRPKV